MAQLVSSGAINAVIPLGRNRLPREVITDNNREADFQFRLSSFREVLRDSIDTGATLSVSRMFARPGIPVSTHIVKFSGL